MALPGFVGPNLPRGFATPVAYGDLATALLAILALLTVRVRFLFWALVWAFNLVGLADLVVGTGGQRGSAVSCRAARGRLRDPHALCTSAFLDAPPRVLAAATWPKRAKKEPRVMDRSGRNRPSANVRQTQRGYL